jgi:hypothetical protein
LADAVDILAKYNDFEDKISKLTKWNEKKELLD